MTFEEIEAGLRARLEATPVGSSRRTHPRPSPPRLRPSGRDRDLLGHPETRAFGELLIDLEEDKAAWAVIFGLLAEMERK